MTKEAENKVVTEIEKVVEESKETIEQKEKNIEIEKIANETTAEKIKEMFSDNEAISLAEAAAQNNEIVFEVEGTTYRVRKTTFQEKQDANHWRMKKYIEFLRDKECLLEKDLRVLYKERGIDIIKLEKEINELTVQQRTLLFDLGKAIKENKPKIELDKYKEEVSNILLSIQGLSLEKQQLLEFSLENRVIMEVYSFMIWKISEKKVGDKWESIWSTYEDFLNTTPNEVLRQVTKNGAVLITEEMTLQNGLAI